MSEEKEEKKLEVKDRRRFSEDKKAESAAGRPGAATGPSPAETKRTDPGKEGDGRAPVREEKPPAEELPEINFATFVISLSSSVLIHLGLVPDPMTGESRKELPLAKQTIDILAMLEAKTKGNLAKEEAELIEHLLYDLRLRFVELSRKG